MASAPGPKDASAPGPRAASARRPIAAAAAALRHPRSVYYGWWLLAGSVVAMALGSGVSFWAFGLYVEPFEDDFGWSRAEVSFAFSIALLSGGVAGPLIGRWIDVRGPREVILVGAVMTLLVSLSYMTRDATPNEFISMTPYMITLIVLVFASQRLRMPAADGMRWRKGQVE